MKHLFPKYSYLFLFVIFFSFNVVANKTIEFTEQPNVVFIIVDDLNDYEGTFNGHPQVNTGKNTFGIWEITSQPVFAGHKIGCRFK